MPLATIANGTYKVTVTGLRRLAIVGSDRQELGEFVGIAFNPNAVVWVANKQN